MVRKSSELRVRLDEYYRQVRAIILARQNPITGLLPASTAVTAHGDYTDAWVRDNVYSILAAWGLGLAYRKLDEDQGRTFELEHSVVKLMRGLLVAMMKQAHKVERFKETQSLLDAMHAKYDTQTGDTVVGDDEWGHLQLDATSLFLLMLAQMTASGLAIVFTIDEVNFVQNLVYYIGRAYRTPDYGIWERGNKINHGHAELNASSVGMAKAALEAINGLNLFGARGSQSSVIHVQPDEIARARITLESLLPRESNSKEVDAALLSIISYPAFAIEDVQLVERTRTKIVEKLQGRYGCKRFLRDGHQTVLEDTRRLHYEPFELREFEHIECEWPLFFTYLVLDGLFRHNPEQVQDYRDRLQPLLVQRDGWSLLPELYYVPADRVEAERAVPNSQVRLPNENVPLVWAQSLYLLGELLAEGLLEVGDIDPLNRHLRIGKYRDLSVQIALLAEDEALQDRLEAHGIATQTPKQLEPMQVRTARDLGIVYTQIGRNDRLRLTGRSLRRSRSLATSRVFRIRGETMVFLPSFLDQQEFYLTLDHHFLVDQLKSELAYIERHWDQLGRPTLTILITTAMLEAGSEALLNLMQELKDGLCNGVRVRLGPMHQLMLTAGTERIDFLHNFEFQAAPVKDAATVCNYLIFHAEKNWPLSYTQEFSLECETNIDLLLSSLRRSENLYEQIELLNTLCRLQGMQFDTGFGQPTQVVTVADLLNEIYSKAAKLKLWAIVRRAAGLLNKVDIGLSDAVTDILVRQKQITVGKSYSKASLITQPMPQAEVMERIREFCGEDIRDRVLSQEILIYLGLLIKAEPQLFDGLLTLRVGYFILLIVSELARELNVTQDEAYERLMQLSPFEVKLHLRQALAGYEELNRGLFQQESLHLVKGEQTIEWIIETDNQDVEQQSGSWLRKRQLQGTVNRVPQNFYPRVWQLFKHCKGLIIGDKLERRNRLDSEPILAEMTPDEQNFALRVEHLLNKIQAPEYRQLNIETLMQLATMVEANRNLQIEEYIVLDVLIGHAVRLAFLDRFPERAERYDEFKGEAWRSFYDSSPYHCASYVVQALRFLSRLGQGQLVDQAMSS
ncbi:glycoside hydrolase family 15 protein [Leptolyngbya sp. FACHB-261]|uniref:glycoside hydrolase family 15 protein n=1 Tax=Leptolyngbya sp. FACHB-261 TaxID=2692806 RepID=UPI001687408D|nr:glycoside hydrolase family 15 protein [Leptolyngbya sp. FACHB-261]MBD2101312.1 glycoside hydrolase family 15 protein [Leptolyngbya sp. FACHB-261]